MPRAMCWLAGVLVLSAFAPGAAGAICHCALAYTIHSDHSDESSMDGHVRAPVARPSDL